MALDMEKLIAHAKNNGFVYQGSEIYDGLANTWDYGPLGVELKNNIKRAWWKRFIQESPYNVGIDSAIFMNPRVWEASGHIGNFNDPLIDCKKCGKRHRADKLIEAYDPNMHADGMEPEEMMAYIREHNIGCPDCGGHDFTDIRKFELMFETSMGVVKDAKSTVYLRPETAQGIFVNFKNVARTTRKKVPFGIGQIGKSFRNEITPGNFIFRTREFEQMELEFFTKPDTDLEWFSYWRSACMNFLKDLGLKEENLRFRDHEQKELSFYSKATTDPTTHEKYVPYVIEPSVGADRLFLSVIADAYDEEELEGGDTRIVMHLHPALAPIKVAVLPLTKKLSEKAEAIYASLSADFNTEYDVSGKIGKRYRRQDEIGTPLCVTVDFDTLEDEAVTVRDRDTMKQERVKIEDLKDYIAKRVAFK